MAEVTISSNNRIVIPKEARVALGLKPGEKLLVVVRGNAMTIIRKPKDYLKALSGIVRPGTYGDDYVRKERESWD
jgi:AbrB family looped-hinge helix DNA binding protein